MKSLIGESVINIHRTNPIVGKIVRFEEGVNGGTVVRWEGQSWDSHMVTDDLALVRDWPVRGENGESLGYKRLSTYNVNQTSEESNEN